MSTVFGPKGLADEPSTLLLGSGTIEKGRGVVRGADADRGVRAGANAEIIGVALDDEDVVDRAFGVYYKPGANVQVEIGAAVAVDARLTTNATGQFVTATAGQNVSAIAREAGTAAGQYIVAQFVEPKTARVAP